MAIRFTSEFRSETGIDYKIEIDDSLFVGSPSTFKVAAEGFVLEYAGETDDIVSPIMSSNVSIPFMVETVLQETFFEQLVSVQESRFRLKISRFDSGSYKTYWTGYIMQDIAQIEDVSFPYIYDLRAVDGLGRLANIDYNINNDIFQNSLALTRLNKILYNCLSSIGTTDLFGSGEAFLETCVNWWENNMVYSTTKDAANEIAVDRRIFTTIDDEGVEIYTKMIDVLRQLCVTFGSRVYQSNGRFIFEQYSERAAATRIVSTYNRSGNYIATTSKSDDVVINKTPGAARMAGNQFDFLPAIKRCEIEFQQKFMGSRVGQILFSHNRTTAQVFGFISADANASLQINCPSIRYYVTNGAPPPPSVPFNSIVPIFGLMIRIEDVNNPGVYWYYSRAFNGYNTPTPYGPASWTTTASDYMFDPGNSKFNQNGDVAILSTINIQTDQLPVSGELVFQLKQPVLRRVFNNSLLSAPPLYNGLPINSVITYNYFANVDYVSDGKLNPQSVIYRASNNNTQIESNLVLSLGFTSVADGPLQTGNLAVYTGSAWVGSDQWRKGNSGSYKKILQLVVTEALGLHAKPIRRYNGSFFFSQDISRRFTFNLYDWLFIGGRFTANIENVDGEFFAIARDVSDVVDLNNDFIDGELQPTSANKYNGPNSFGGVFTDGSIGGMLVDTDTTSVGPFSEPTAGTARITGTTTIDGDANFTQDVEVTGDLIVDGTIVIDGLGDVATEQWVIDQGYLTAESDTLDSVTDRGNVTTNTINVGGVTTDYVLLDTAATPTLQTGMFAWNDTEGTSDLRLKGNNVTLQIGQEEVIRIVNKTGSNLLESQYKVVRTRTAAEGGAQGQRLAVLLAQADTKANHTGILGLVTENINNNQEGFVTSFGFVRNINTTGSLQGQTWNDGDTLWLSDSVAGGLTNVEPTTHAVQIGYVTYSHSNNGKIFVKIDEGVDELSELHDVNTSSISADQLLKRNSSNTFWENWTPNFLTPSNVSGTTNYISKFTGANTVGNSQIFDNGTNVGIGTATPGVLLEANGVIRSTRTGAASQYVEINGGDAVGPFITAAGANKVLTIQNNSTTSSVIRFNQAVASEYTWLQAGTERMRISSTGNVGIGTTSPGSLLQLYKANADAEIISERSDAGTGARYVLSAIVGGSTRWRFATIDTNSFATFVNGSERMRITSTGNVGIGTTSPAASLHVGATGGVIFGATAGAVGTAQITTSSATSPVSTRFAFGTDGTGWQYRIAKNTAGTIVDLITVADSGNVGIGTTTPGASIHVAGAINSVPTGDGFLAGIQSGYAIIHLNGSAATGSIIDFSVSGTDTKGRILYDNTNNYFGFNTNGSERLRITSTGNVGIGTTSPFSTAKLQVKTATDINVAIQTGTTNTSGIKINAFNDAGNANIPLELNGSILSLKTGEAERMHIASGGNVGIGTTAPAQKLSVEGGSIQLNANNAAANYYLYLNKKSGQDGGILFNRDNVSDWQLNNGAGNGDLIFYSYGTASEAITFKRATGNVGIGTTTPAARLDVAGDLRTYNGITSRGDHSYTFIENILPAANNGAGNGDVQLRMWCSEPGVTWNWAGFGYNVRNDNGSPNGFGRVNTSFGQSYMRFATTGDWYFYNTNTSGTRTTTMTLSSAGNVGIGTTSPGSKLNVSGGFIRVEGTSTDQYFFEGVRTGTSTTLRIYDNGSRPFYDSYSSMYFRANQTGGSGGIIGLLGGDVGIGTASPGFATAGRTVVSLNGSSTSLFEFQTGGSFKSYLYQSGSAFEIYDTTAIDLATAGSIRVRINSSGNVGIGTTSPSAKLHVIGNVTVSATLSTANAKISGTLADSFNQVGTAGQILSSTGTGVEWITGGGGGGGSTIVVKDEGTTIGSSFTTLDFYGTNIQASASGSTAVITTFNNAGTGSNFLNAISTNYAIPSTWGDVEIDGSPIFAASPDAATGSSKLIATVTFGVENVSSFEVFNNFEFRLYNVNSGSPITDTTHTWTGFMSKDEGATRTVFTFHIPLKDEVTPGDEIRVQAQQLVSYTPEIYFCSMTLLEGTD